MSVKAMSWVWEHSRAKGSARLVLLALADHAGADGGDAYPSIRRLSQRCGIGERTVQEALQALVALGEIEVEANAGPRGVNRYRLTMPPQIPHPADSAPRNLSQGPPQNTAPAPADSAPEPSRTTLEPSSSSSTSDSRAVPATVWRKIAERKATTRTGAPIGDLAAWLRKTAANALEEQSDRAEWLWATFDITESQLVDVLLAGGSSPLLASLRRRAA